MQDGSSPWARGTLCWLFPRDQSCRFIPVGTGNTHVARLATPLPAVHPRGHGEHPMGGPVATTITGSSPWARGTLQL